MGLVPDKYTIDGDVTIRFDRDGLLMLFGLIIIVIIIAFLVQRWVKNIKV